MEVLEGFDAATVRAHLESGRLFWLRLKRPSPEVMHEVGELLGLSELAVHDSIEFGQRSKIEDYPGSALVVFHGARTEQTEDGPLPRPVEVHLHVTPHALVTVRRENPDAVGDVRRRVRLEDVDTLEEVVYRVLDAMAASFGPSLHAIDDEVDALEDEVIDDPRPDARRRLLDLKHALVRLRQVVDGSRDELAGRRDLLERIPGFHDGDAHDSMRDVYDRLVVVSHQIDSVKDSISSALDLYVAAVSNRLNEIMKVLTIVATFFLPLTFLTGFFGQNFPWMVDHISGPGHFLVLGVGLALAIVAGLLVWMRHRGYLAPSRQAPADRSPAPPAP